MNIDASLGVGLDHRGDAFVFEVRGPDRPRPRIVSSSGNPPEKIFWEE
jgi:hypothetical protein